MIDGHGIGAGLRHLGEAEVEQLHARPGQHDVPGFEVAVHDAAAVRGIERSGDLGAEGEHLVDGQRPFPQPVGERLALEVLHDQEVDAVLVSHVEEGADVGVLEARDRLGLALQPLLELGAVRQVRGQHLDRDRALEPGVAGAVHLAHAAGAGGLFDSIRAELGSGDEAHVHS